MVYQQWIAMSVACAALGAAAHAAPATPAGSSEERYACERIFTFGLWGCEPRAYDLGLEALLRDMRRHAMNCLVAGPGVGDGPEGIERLKRDLALCRRHGVSAIPYVGGDPERVAAAAAALKEEPAILGWYIRDEPPPEFLPEFIRCRDGLRQVVPSQPALCLFYRPDSAAAFAPHQPILLTDCYPLTYMHNGTSIGPHFAVREGPLALGDGMGQFNMWGNRGVLEWMDLCRARTGARSHWITLQAFESGNGHQVRWREPTAADIRLQTYMAIAGGATGINYFRYGTMTDDYGRPLPAVHAEHTPLWVEIGRLGAEITPLGPLLVEAEVVEPLTVNATLRPTPDPGNGIEVRRLRSRVRPVEYLVALNHDVHIRSTAQINLSRPYLQGRRLYDMQRLEPLQVRDWPGAVTAALSLPPGGGAVLAVAPETEFPTLARTVLQGRCANEAAALDLDYELAQRSRVELRRVEPLREGYEARIRQGNYAAALPLIRQCAAALERASQESSDFCAARRDLDALREAIARLDGQPAARRQRLSEAYRGLLGLFWQGKAREIRRETSLLRDVVERLTSVEGDGWNEQDLQTVERTSRAYTPNE